MGFTKIWEQDLPSSVNLKPARCWRGDERDCLKCVPLYIILHYCDVFASNDPYRQMCWMRIIKYRLPRTPTQRGICSNSRKKQLCYHLLPPVAQFQSSLTNWMIWSFAIEDVGNNWTVTIWQLGRRARSASQPASPGLNN